MERYKEILRDLEGVMFDINLHVTNQKLHDEMQDLLDQVWEILNHGINNSE